MEWTIQNQKEIISSFKKEIEPLLNIKVRLLKTSVIVEYRDGKFIYDCQDKLDHIDSILTERQEYCQSLLDKLNKKE